MTLCHNGPVGARAEQGSPCPASPTALSVSAGIDSPHSPENAAAAGAPPLSLTRRDETVEKRYFSEDTFTGLVSTDLEPGERRVPQPNL